MRQVKKLGPGRPAGRRPTVNPPISAFKSVAGPPVYTPTSRPPRLSYRDKHRMAESRMLYSLFREDTAGKTMKAAPSRS